MHGPYRHDLIALVVATRTLEKFLRALADRAMEYTPDCDGCGVTLERRGQPLTVASTGDSATRLDEKQYGQDAGPCLEALRTGREVSVPDMIAERRWGAYGAFAVAHGTLSSLSVPIAAWAGTAGALNLYSSRSDGFATADLPFLRSLAAEATGAVALAQAMADSQTALPRMRERLASRTLVGQAAGIVMAERGTTHREALEVLMETAQERGVGLSDVSAELVARYGGTPGDEGTAGEGGAPSAP
ncbi:GAF and ANTAR domain-containing protein [Actinacidiphila acidipaludis]